MSEELQPNVIGWVVGGISTTIAGVMGFLMKRTVTRLDDDLDAHEERLNEHDRQHTSCSLELANFKTEVANNYAKDATVQQSLSRIHDRIDEVSSDIKKLIGMVK